MRRSNGQNERDDAPSAHCSPQTRPTLRCADTERLRFGAPAFCPGGHCRAEGRATLGHCGKAARTATLALGRLPNRIKLYPRCVQEGRHLRIDAPKGEAVRAFRGEERTGGRGSATAHYRLAMTASISTINSSNLVGVFII
jgi:hypothetical protein